MDDRLLLLHLTDLHLGAGELRPEDAKVTIAAAERRRFVDRLGDYVRALPSRPYLVCVTGDITNRGDPSGFHSFLTWIKPLIADGVLPPPHRFLITSGNHDVTRAAPDDHARFQAFYEVARAFPHAFVPGNDPPLGEPAFDKTAAFEGGMTTEERYGAVEVIASKPYFYDRDARLLVFAFNSSLGCGVYPAESTALLGEIDKAIDMAAADSALMRQLHILRERAATDLLIDAGLVGDDQIAYFNRLMRTVRGALGPEWRRITKVALLHHHVNPIWRQQLELKPFESVIDSAQLKQALTEFGFDVVLHGHKHLNGVSLDTTLVPTGTERSHDPIGIVSGGTVCGYPALNDRQTFKVLILDRSTKRESAVVEEYPLRDAADPAQAMRAERRVYRLPLADRIPELHDDKSLKTLLDEMLLDEVVQAVGAASVRIDRGQVKLGGDTDLVAAAARYRFIGLLKTKSQTTFLDVFLATSRLDFRQRTRIHSMLVDVQHYASTRDDTPRVQVVIGSLAGTHFSRERSAGEISASIDELRTVFQPAIMSGRLEIVERGVTQKEVDELDQSIPVASRESY